MFSSSVGFGFWGGGRGIIERAILPSNGRGGSKVFVDLGY